MDLKIISKHPIMEAFNYIIHTKINKQPGKFNIKQFNPHDLDARDKDFIIRYSFYSLLCKKTYELYPTIKFQALREVMENIFFTEENKDDFLTLFCRIQKIYHGFAKMAYLFQYKRAPVLVNKDIFMEPLTTTQKNVIVLYQKGHKYLFTIPDLLTIMKNALSHNEHYFPTPLPCKNPYNNLVFDKQILIHIYFFMKDSAFLMPSWLHSFFLTEFDLFAFKQDNHVWIREEAMNQYIQGASQRNLFFEILDMLNEYNKKNHFKCFRIHKDFPQDKLVEVFLPYYTIYHCWKKTNLRERSYHKKEELYHKLNRFYYTYPHFGRKYKGFALGKKDIFNMAHVPFHETIEKHGSHARVTSPFRFWGGGPSSQKDLNQYVEKEDLLEDIEIDFFRRRVVLPDFIPVPSSTNHRVSQMIFQEFFNENSLFQEEGEEGEESEEEAVPDDDSIS